MFDLISAIATISFLTIVLLPGLICFLADVIDECKDTYKAIKSDNGSWFGQKGDWRE